MVQYAGTFPSAWQVQIPYFTVNGWEYWASSHNAIPDGTANFWNDDSYPQNTIYSQGRAMVMLYTWALWQKIFGLPYQASFTYTKLVIGQYVIITKNDS